MKKKHLDILKATVSELPVLSQILGSWDKYQQDQFNRSAKRVLGFLSEKVGDPSSLFSDDWLKSEEGETFTRKVLDSAIDAQLADKQQLFINALINGIEDKETEYLEKLKFIDMLRHLSRPALDVLAKMHSMFKDQVRRPGNANTITAVPHVDSTGIAEQLSSEFNPYLVTASIHEMTAQGLFHNIAEWRKKPDGSYASGVGFESALAYTDFTFRFVEFITHQNISKLTED